MSGNRVARRSTFNYGRGASGSAATADRQARRIGETLIDKVLRPGRLDDAAAAHPNPGRPAPHRLNRTEYANSVRDLLDLDVAAAAYLPPDDMSHGFDNMAEVLNVSPTLMEGYVRAAGKISRLAVGDPTTKPIVETYHLPSTRSQTRHIDGTPFGTRGGIAVRHNFPADGEYVVRIDAVFHHQHACPRNLPKGRATRGCGER